MLLPETAQFDSQKSRFPKLFQNLNRLWTGTSYPAGWWTVTAHGVPIRHFGDKGMAERYASDPEYRASVVSRRL